MKKINSNIFQKIGFFLSGSVKVNTLKEGAISHGGATRFEDGIYSNIEGSEFIEIKEDKNSISIFIPSTDDINKKVDNRGQVKKSINYLKRFYNISNNLRYYNTMGSWYSDDLQKTVIEDITIVTLELETLQKHDIDIFINLAEIVKKDMKQEGVSISINESLAII